MIKALVASLTLVMLTGCASRDYSAPDSAYSSYERAPRALYRDPYFDPVYYPWWSVDYFYLGSHRYRPVYGSSFFFGLSSGYPYYGPYFLPGYYSPWYAPYRYYDPRFGPYYGWGGGYWRYDPFWRHAYGRQVYPAPRHSHSRGDDRRDGSYRGDESAGYHKGARSRGDGRQGGFRAPRDRQPGVGAPPGQKATGPAGSNRNVSVAPSRDTTDRGMVIINRGDGKLMPSRVEPVSRPGVIQSAPPQSPATSPAARPARSYSAPDRVPQQDSGDDVKHQAADSKHWPDKRRTKPR